MEPFYFLKCEHRDDRPRGRMPSASAAIARSSCAVCVFGKDEDGATVAVELLNYLPAFYVSFRDRATCARVLNATTRRMREFGDALTASADGDGRVRSRAATSHVRGMETATGFSSLIVNKDHQDKHAASRGPDYGDTSLSFTFRVTVRCFAHVRPAVREILEAAAETAGIDIGSVDAAERLGRDVRFYQSALEPDVLIAETLKLRPCRWTRFDPTVCRGTEFDEPYGHLRSARPNALRTYAYDFEDHVDRRTALET